jgi:site-specific DNA recombinase
MTTRAVAYFRMSTDAQEGSIPAQRAWAKQAAARVGLRLLREFEDPGISGGLIDQRPGLQALLDYADRQFAGGTPLDAILVWDPDRLSRADSLKTAAVLSRLKDAGVGRLLTASDGPVDLDDATHRVLYLLKQDLARSDFCEKLARNTLRGKVERAKQGFWLGGLPPFGYRMDAGRLVPDPADGPVVSWLFSAYAAGAHTFADLLDELHKRGVVPVRERRRRAEGQPAGPAYWARNIFPGLFSNKAYLGHTVWNLRRYGRYARVQGGRVVKDESARAREQDRRRRGLKEASLTRNDPADVFVVEDTHPPLTDAATFAAVQRRLVANKRRTTPCRGGGQWLLSGMVRCAACGSAMHGKSSHAYKNGTQVRYYVCERAYRSHSCWAVKSVRQDELLKEVLDTVRERFAEGPALDAVRAEVARLAGKGKKGLEAERARLAAAVKELEGKIAQGTANLALLPPDMLPKVVAHVRAWEEERDRAASALEKAAAAAESGRALVGRVDEALEGLRNLHETVAAAPPAVARAALAEVVSKVTVQLRRARRTADMKLAYVEVEVSPELVKLFATS